MRLEAQVSVCVCISAEKVELLTDLRMLTRGLGTGLDGLLSKLSGRVDDPWPLFLAWRAN